jgi:flagellar assembly protein FliH
LFTDTTTRQTATGDATPARKFMFEKSFDHGANAAARAPERKPVTLKPEQYDALKKEAYDLGFASGQKAGADEMAQRQLVALARIEEQVTHLLQNFVEFQSARDAEMRSAIVAIAKKMLPAYVARHGVQEIEATLKDVIGEMVHEPRLVVRVHETQFDIINTRVQEVANQKAYAGKIVVLADETLAVGDCRVEWADGGIERNAAATWSDIEKVVAPDQPSTGIQE